MENKENIFKDIIHFSTVILILHYFLSWICNIKILDYLGIYARFSILTIEDIMFPIAQHNYKIMVNILIIPITFEILFNILNFLKKFNVIDHYFIDIRNKFSDIMIVIAKFRKEIIILLPIFSITITFLVSNVYYIKIYIMMFSLVLLTALYYVLNINKRGLMFTIVIFYVLINIFSFDKVIENFQRGVKEREMGKLLSVSVYDKEDNILTNDSIYFVHKFSNYTILGKRDSKKDYMIYSNDDISRYEYKKKDVTK